MSAVAKALNAKTKPLETRFSDSTVLNAIGYDMDTKRLAIEFVTGTVFIYLDVDIKVYRGFLKAKSVGKYYNAHVRGQYQTQGA